MAGARPSRNDGTVPGPEPSLGLSDQKEISMKKSSKVFAAAAAGALALTAAATVTANAGPGSAATAVPAADVQPVPENLVQQNRISAGASAKAVSAALAKCQAEKLPFVAR
jgi:hypothetical protein